METRIDLFRNEITGAFIRNLNAATKVIASSSLPRATQQLVELRASQINGCSFCTDMHTKDACTPARTRCGSTWSPRGGRRRCSPRPSGPRSCSPRRGPGIADAAGGVSDDTWAGVRKHYDDEQIGALIAVIGMINLYNRFNVIARTPAGGYQPGMFG